MPVSQLNDKSIFNAAREIDSEEARRDYLQRVCGGDLEQFDRVAALLEGFHKNSRFLESPAVNLMQTSADPVSRTLASPVLERPGTQIGPYIIREQLGEGGMGVVYVAEQTEPVRRQVALKIIKPGMDSKEVLARFDAERQALAMMSHPNIAKILDGGTTEAGRPYFVMELVKGVSITKYCDNQKLNTRERLELFVTVCQAVQHAHLKGIIHRDLKPSNILVELHDVTAVPKVIDFGVAKATHQRLTQQTIYTQFSQMLGTPLYMSPEQAQLSGLDIDTRSDVYSLGVVLYELLTGSTPFEKSLATAGYDEMRRIIQEDEPPRPSYRISTLKAEHLSTLSERQPQGTPQLERQVERELDWIVMKALEKDRVRRYESASALAADIRRYLNGDLVHACPPSVGYRLQKYVRRHKGLLATAALLMTTLLMATCVSVAYAFQADQAKIDAQQKSADAVAAKQLADQRLAQSRLDFDRAIKALDTVVEQLSSAEFAQIPGVEKTRSETLQRMIKLYEEIAQEHNNDPYARQQQALAYGRIAKILKLTGEHKKADSRISQGIEMMEEILKTHPEDREYKLSLASLLFDRLHHDATRNRTEKLEDAERALRIYQELGEPISNGHVYQLGLMHLKVAQCLPQDSPQIEQHLAESIRIPVSHGVTPNSDSYITVAMRAETHRDWEAAEKNYRRGLEQMRHSVDSGDRVGRGLLSKGLSRFASLLNSLGRSDEAKELHLEAIDGARQLFQEYGKIPVYESMLDKRVREYKRDAMTKQQKAEALKVIGELIASCPEDEFLRWTRAELLIETDQTDEATQLLIDGKPDTALEYARRAKLYVQLKEFDKALADYRKANELDPDNSDHLTSGVLMKICGDYTGAAEQWQQALQNCTDPFVDYSIRIQTPGIYQLYLRPGSHDSDSDSLYVRIVELGDGPGGVIADWFRYYVQPNEFAADFAANGWPGSAEAERTDWAGSHAPDSPMVWHISRPGDYTVRFIMRDTGIASDAFVLQLASRPAPTGNGPSASEMTPGKQILESDGLVVVEAEHFSFRNIGADGHQWRVLPKEESEIANYQNYRRGAYLQALPDIAVRSKTSMNMAIFAEADALKWDIERCDHWVKTEPDNPNWYSCRAQAYAGLNETDKAIADFSKAIELQSENERPRRGRTQLFANKNRWKDSFDDFAKAIQLKPDECYLRYQFAVVALGAGDRAGYRVACQDMLEAFADSDVASETHFTAWTCALAPAAIDDYAPAITLARHAVEKEPGNQQYLNGLGAILMRSGQYEDAKVELEKALAADDTANTSQSYSRYFLATTEHQLGHEQAAQEQLAIANASAEEELAGTPSWNRKLTLQLLQKESETLIGKP